MRNEERRRDALLSAPRGRVLVPSSLIGAKLDGVERALSPWPVGDGERLWRMLAVRWWARFAPAALLAAAADPKSEAPAAGAGASTSGCSAGGAVPNAGVGPSRSAGCNQQRDDNMARVMRQISVSDNALLLQLWSAWMRYSR